MLSPLKTLPFFLTKKIILFIYFVEGQGKWFHFLGNKQSMKCWTAYQGIAILKGPLGHSVA